MKRIVFAFAAAAGLAPVLAAQASPQLAAPFRVATADGKLIDVDVGHAAPLLADFDQDGLQDLLVGQFGEGRLRIYKNVGTKTAPSFKGFTDFQAGGTTGKVPTG